jgi:hypothetical protein
MKSQPVLCKSLAVLFTVFEFVAGLVCLLGLFSIVLSFCDLTYLPTSARVKCGLVNVRTEIDASTLQLKSPAIAPSKIQFVGTMYVLLNPEYSKDFLKAMGVPRGVSMLTSGVLFWAIADLFRRMFRSVERRDVFTATNVRHIRWIGCLLILGGVLMKLMLSWQATAEVAFARSNLATEGISYFPAFSADVGHCIHSIITGLIVLALAEVFNQGILLKQDNDLTV